MGVRRYHAVMIAAAVFAAGTLAMCWPGIVDYDSEFIYRQALTGVYYDWHPPIMARWWAALHTLVGGGAGPMLAAQVLAYWLGLGLIAGALARTGRLVAAIAVLALGALPVFSAWQMTVLKDTQMLGAALAGVGVVAWWRLHGEQTPWPARVAACVMLGYALLVRSNAAFAIVPLAVMLLPDRRWPTRLGLIAVGILVVIVATPAINQRLMGARETGVRKTVPLYDLAGIAVRSGDTAATGLDDRHIAALRARRCVKPYFWDPLGDGPCAVLIRPLNAQSAGRLYAMLAGAALRHPFAYVAHRLAHLNSTERWLVPAGLLDRWAADESEPSDLGLVDPPPAAAWFIDGTSPLADTPLGWPMTWLVLGIVALVEGTRRPPSPLRDLALALAVSAVALEASFAAVSISSDARYHLWSMMAAGLAAILLFAERRPGRWTLAIGGAALLFVAAGGVAARLTLPPGPDDYDAMLVS